MYNSRMKELPDYDYLHSLIEYDPDSGVIRRRKTTHGSSGKPLKATKCHHQICIDKKNYGTHRIIWKMMTGNDPGEMLVEHEDQDFTNNKWSNLRLATTSQNAINIRQHKGVAKTPSNTWRANVKLPNGRRLMPTFKTEQEAIDWRHTILSQHYGEFHPND